MEGNVFQSHASYSTVDTCLLLAIDQQKSGSVCAGYFVVKFCSDPTATVHGAHGQLCMWNSQNYASQLIFLS